MRRTVVVVAALVAVVIPAAGCSSASSHSAGVTTTTGGPSTTVPVATTTAPATTSTTVALIPQETPDLAATALFNAWHAGDRHGALQVAIAPAVAALFAQAPESFSDRGCQSPLNGMASCAFGLGGNAAIAQVQTVTLAGGWVVQAVNVNPNS